jgi:hypothetical protein
MRLKCLCIEERTESYVGKRGAVTQVVLALLDMSPEDRLVNTFDYNLSAEEAERFRGKLRDKPLELGVTAFEAAFGGRLRARGRLILQA